MLHGVRLADPYRWLEDERSPEVEAWVAAQDAYARGFLARLPRRPALSARARELFYSESMNVPVQRGGWIFYERRPADREKAVLIFRQGEGGAEQVLLDPNRWSSDGSISLGEWSPSWDGRKLAFQVRRNNSDEATLRIVDVSIGEVSPVDDIAGGKYAVPPGRRRGTAFTTPGSRPIPPSPRPTGRGSPKYGSTGSGHRPPPIGP